MTTRVILFVDPRDVAARILVPELLRHLRGRSDPVCVGLVLTHAQSYREALYRHWAARATRWLQLALGSGVPERVLTLPPLPADRLARDHQIPYLVAPGGDPNHGEVIKRLKSDLQADAAINVYGRKRFGEPLLTSFDTVVNFHNGLLPRCRGLRASNWSIYMGEPASGYAFHRMDAGMDTGDVLVEGKVPVRAGETPADLERRKATAACLDLPRLLDAIARRESGRPQEGIGGEHTRQAFLLATCVDDPSALTKEEWRRRLQAFLRIWTVVGGERVPITGLASAAGPGRRTFRTIDGHWLRVSGLDFWPSWLHSCRKRRP